MFKLHLPSCLGSFTIHLIVIKTLTYNFKLYTNLQSHQIFFNFIHIIVYQALNCINYTQQLIIYHFNV